MKSVDIIDERHIRAVGGGPSLLDRFCKAPALNWHTLCASLGIIASVSGITSANAQEAEPRSYSNSPIGLNFLIAGYVYAQGKMAFDPDLAVADAKFNSNTGVLAYIRSFDFGGQSAKFDVIVPASSFPRMA